MLSVHDRACGIRMLVLDVDGVLTDGRLYFTNEGEELKAFHTLDGHGIKLWQRAGGITAIITGRKAPLVEYRARNLGIAHLYQGREDKGRALRELSSSVQIPLESIAYVGDDMPDLGAFKVCGLAIAVANAHPYVRDRAHWVTQNTGGKGAVREVCDMLLQAQGSWDSLVAEYMGD